MMTNKEKDMGKEATSEKRQLLAKNAVPSPGSTNRPSLFGYGAAADGSVEEPLIQMSVSKEHLVEDAPYYSDASSSPYDSMMVAAGDSTFRRQMRRNQLLTRGVMVAVCLAAAMGVYHVALGPRTAPHNPHPHPQDENTNGHDDHPSSGKTASVQPPLSNQHPVHDLHLHDYRRTSATPGTSLFGPLLDGQSRPTNAWYENLVLVGDNEPTQEQRVYPLPYLVDTVGPLPGIRINSPWVKAGGTDIQLIEVPQHGITMGAAPHAHHHDAKSLLLSLAATNSNNATSKKYTITHMTPLGITLEWNATKDDDAMTYSTSMVRGMPYATMVYHNTRQHNTDMVPSMVTEIPLASAPLVDGSTSLTCHKKHGAMDMLHLPSKKSTTTVVQQEVVLTFTESDYTWIVFVSRPVHVQCTTNTKKGADPFLLQFIDDVDEEKEDGTSTELVVRVALMNDCTRGGNPNSCGRGSGHHNDTELGRLLRQNADLYPGPNTGMDYSFVEEDHNKHKLAAADAVKMTFDWNVQSMSNSKKDDDDVSGSNNGDLLMYALPHHQDLMEAAAAHDRHARPPFYAKASTGDRVCQSTLLGKTCLVQGSTWSLEEDFASHNYTSFRAPRPPHHSALPALVAAYHDDLNYTLPAFFQRGAGDTYFSGKMLAKLARILTIGEELSEMCASSNSNDNGGVTTTTNTPQECRDLVVPSTQDAEFQDAVARLRSGVEIWINGTGATPFVYDSLWGGLVSCGCDFDGKHKGGVCRNKYPECAGLKDPGLNFGNAFYNDHHFHYGYHIYAAAAVAHFDPKWGRKHFEQIMLYIRDIANPSKDDEAFPMFRQKDWYQGSSWASGIAVSPINGRNQESSSESIAAYEAIGLFGKEMVRAFHDDSEKAAVAKQVFNYGQLLTASEVRSASKYWHVLESPRKRQYPKEYTPHVIGMLWTNMAQFQTWFGNHPYLAIGIQLLPLTAVSEERDSINWVLEMYQEFADSCSSQSVACEAQGWSVLVMAMLATVGHRDEAIEQALNLNATEVFTSAGGNGHSLTNTLWYLSTRPYVKHPLGINVTSVDGTNTTSYGNADDDDEYNVDEYDQGEDIGSSKVCPPCSKKVCQGPFNKCPVPNAPFLCTEGQNTGGCSRAPWTLGAGSCVQCCEVTYGCAN